MRIPRLLPLAVGLALAGSGTGCGTGGGLPAPADTGSLAAPASARAELAARAAAAQDLVGVTLYTLTTAGRQDRTVMVVRAADGGWRVDIPGGALGGTVDISIVATAGERYQCRLATPPERGGCVPVSELAAAADPRVQHLFTDWLEVLTDRSAAVAVSAAAPPAGVGGRCFAVQPSSASLVAPLDAGVYCFDTDGTLTGAQLELGQLTLIGTDRTPPPSVDLPGPVVAAGQPLPTASPTPTGAARSG